MLDTVLFFLGIFLSLLLALVSIALPFHSPERLAARTKHVVILVALIFFCDVGITCWEHYRERVSADMQQKALQ
jgi:hypothetical protein